MTDCLFCKMAAGDLAADIVYQNDAVVAFRDINPKAPMHVLVIPHKHIATLNDLQTSDAELVGKLYLTARHVAEAEGIAGAGYRTVVNCNKAGQAVFHIHLHLLVSAGGRCYPYAESASCKATITCYRVAKTSSRRCERFCRI